MLAELGNDPYPPKECSTNSSEQGGTGFSLCCFNLEASCEAKYVVEQSRDTEGTACSSFHLSIFIVPKDFELAFQYHILAREEGSQYLQRY